MNLQNLKMLEMAADHLGSLLEEVVFLGGVTVELWISDPAAPEFRPTVDVDVVVENRWQGEAFHHAEEVSLPNGSSIKVVEPSYLLATKLNAFRTRGKRDFLGSRDFSDIVSLVDGREELMDEVRGKRTS